MIWAHWNPFNPGINLFHVTGHICLLSAGLWGREKVAPERAPVPTTCRAARPWRAARCPRRRWGARLLTTARWARSPTSWWSHGLICTSVKSAAPWAIPAPEVSLGQVGGTLWGRVKMEPCVGHSPASWGQVVPIAAFMVHLFCSSAMAGCAFPLCYPIPLLFLY